MGPTGRRLWRWIAGTAATLLILAAILTGALRIALEQVPGYQAEITARVRAATGLTLRFRSIDARLGWYGPEVWFDGAEVLDRDGREVLVSAEGGSVSLSLPRSIWYRRVEVGRVLLERPRLNFLIFPDRSVELVGQASLRQPARSGRTLELDRLPRGRLEIREAVLAFVDLRPGYEPWQVEGVTLAIERRGRKLVADGHIELPSRFGGTVDFEGLATGDLARPADLAWRLSGSARALDFARWGDLLPGQFEPPSAGRGSLRLEAEGRGLELADATFGFAFNGLVLPSVTDAPPARYRAFTGELRVEQRDGAWKVDGRGLRFELEQSAWKPSELHAEANLAAGRLQRVALRTRFLKLENVVPLLNLVPPGTARDLVLALDLSGQLDDVELVATGFAPGRLPSVSGRLRFRDVGMAPVGNRPGVRGLDGEVRARGEAGDVALDTRDLSLTWPAQWRAVATASELKAAAGWRQAADGLRIWVDDARLDAVGLRAVARLRMFFAGGGESPLMDLSARVTDGDPTQAWRYLPIGRMSPRSLGWVDAAFRAGRIPEATLEITGPIRGFPYREGEGRFFASGRMQGVTLNYVSEWPAATGVSGEFEFRNTSLTVRNAMGNLGGITVGSAEAHIDDWRQTILTVNASATGDVSAALGYLQASPLKEYFKGMNGSGPVRGEAVLYLPLKDMPSKSIVVNASVRNGSLGMAGQAERLTRVSGTLWTRNREVFARGVAGEFLGGPLAGRADTRLGEGGSLVTTAEVSGTLEGERLQAFARLPLNSGLSGRTDWRAALRAERPADPGTPGRYELQVDSQLTGLASGLPDPLRKAEGESRPLHAEVTLPRPGVVEAEASFGADTRAAIEWRREAQGYQLTRGLVRFGPGPTPALPEADGLRLVGRLPRASLTDVLNLRSAQPSRRRVQDWLTSIDLDVAEPEVLGYRFDRVRASVVPGENGWRVEAQGDTARGQVMVPFDFAGSAPLAVDMDILHVGERVRSGTGELDPRRLPAIRFDVRDLEFDGRRLGHLTAEVARTADGLVAGRLESRHAAFTARGRGSWLVSGDAQRSAATVDADSTDVAATLAAMGYGPWVEARKGTMHAELSWPGPPDGAFLERSSGKIGVSMSDGRIPRVEPGAGRVLGLMSMTHLQQRLALDFKDLTGEGLAFDTIKGDFVVRDGDAYTSNMTLRGPAAEIGLLGRTNFRTREYNQTVVVTGELGASLGVAGALAGGPAVGAALLLFSQLFKEPLKGMTRGYYRITGTWDAPIVQSVTAAAVRDFRRDSQPAPKGEPNS